MGASLFLDLLRSVLAVPDAPGSPKVPQPDDVPRPETPNPDRPEPDVPKPAPPKPPTLEARRTCRTRGGAIHG